ncbi:MAG: DUF4274 domain-containing protein [Pseudomonadota bacterium]
MAVSEARRARIMRYAQMIGESDVDITGWTDEELEQHSEQCAEETREFLNATTAADELHLFATYWNWDEDPEFIKMVATHDHADAGTLLLVYWRSAPEYNRQFPGRVNPNDTLDGPVLLAIQKLIEARFVDRDIQTWDIPFDPANDDGLSRIGLYDMFRDKFIEDLPEIMYQALPGRTTP